MSLTSTVELARHMPRISEVLFDEPSRSFSSLAALPSNVEAIEAALLFATGAVSHVAIAGPSGWGKSHLLEAAAGRFALDLGVRPEIHSALEWLAEGGRYDAPGPLILDNVQDVLDRSKSRLSLGLILERRLRTSKPTMLAFTAPKASRQIKNFLPVSREWCVRSIAAPSAAERTLIIQQIATTEGLRMGTVLVDLIAKRMKGNGRTLSGALKRLKLSGVNWKSDSEMLRACGTLDMFFSDDSGWDLHERILATSERPEFRDGQVRVAELTLHTMLHVAGLSESSIARYFGLQPAEVYAIAAQFESRRKDEESARQMSVNLISRVIADLSND